MTTIALLILLFTFMIISVILSTDNWYLKRQRDGLQDMLNTLLGPNNDRK